MNKYTNDQKPKLLPVLLLRGYVPVAGGKKRAIGETIELPADEARRTVKLGIAERADSF